MPTATQLEQMGMVKCATGHCQTWLDPVNVRIRVGRHGLFIAPEQRRDRFCSACQREQREARRTQGFKNGPRFSQHRRAA